MSNKYKNISVISTGSWVPSDQDFLADNKGTYQVQINELVLMVSIGIHEHEKVKKQSTNKITDILFVEFNLLFFIITLYL